MTLLDELQANGFCLKPEVIDTDTLLELHQALAPFQRQAGQGGVRHIAQRSPIVAMLAQSPSLLELASTCLQGPPKLIRTLYFDKSTDNNWLVTWHQDRMVASPQHFEADGWSLWTQKEEVWHAQAPRDFLENMVTLRIHLDDANSHNGCLQVIAGSHQQGILSADAIQTVIQTHPHRSCAINAGGIMLMRPLLLHSSKKTTTDANRRVLHFEYAGSPFPIEDLV